jgi:hypothetical protein
MSGMNARSLLVSLVADKGMSNLQCTMLWEGRPLRDIREADVRALVASGLEEHLQLEYKSALYDDNDRGRTEFLLDICMFANAIGGILLLGIPERRDGDGQPTGAPDPAGILGLDLPNPELVLNSYDARVTSAIEERLPLESAYVDLGEGRRVLAIRIPNSTKKPHSIRYQGHIYLPSRRERQRYHMDVREIKELVMRTASRLQQAEETLQRPFQMFRPTVDCPYLLISMVPVFSEDFMVDVRIERIKQAVANFSRAGQPQFGATMYTFDGLERRDNHANHIVKLHRNGLLVSSLQLPLYPHGQDNQHAIMITAIDVCLRAFVGRATSVYGAAAIGAPFVLGMMLRTTLPLLGAYGGIGGYPDYTDPIPAGNYEFPFMEVDDLSATDRIIRPLCDQAHQMFGRERSPSFDAEGVWVARY